MLKSAVPILASLNEADTISFYTEKLGFTLNSNWDGYLIFSRDQIEIHIWPCDDKNIAKNTACYVRLTEIDELYSEYLPLGIVHPNGKLKVMPWKMKQFSILDNNGNLISFGENIEGNKSYGNQN